MAISNHRCERHRQATVRPNQSFFMARRPRDEPRCRPRGPQRGHRTAPRGEKGLVGVFGWADRVAHSASSVLDRGAAADGGFGGRGATQTQGGPRLPHHTWDADRRGQDGDLAGQATSDCLDSLDRIRRLEDESPRHRRNRMVEDNVNEDGHEEQPRPPVHIRILYRRDP